MSSKSLFTAAVTVGISCVAAAASNSTSFRARFPEAAVQTVDVVVVGGGASGANAAVHFKDAGLSLVLVEKQDRLGGMVNSWTDPTTGTNYDYGVATYTNVTGTVEFFNRLGVDIVEPDEDSAFTSYYADFATGETVDYVAPSVTDELLALERFYNVSSLYQDLFLPSYANWPAPDDIPEDLLMPFRDFAIKYNLNDTMLLIWAGIGAGLADMLDAPTLYLLQTFGPQTAAVFLGTDVQYVPASGRNQDIYDAAVHILDDSVLLNSMVIESVRLPGNLGVELLIQNKLHGTYTIILAKRLVMAIEPTPSNMAPFSLDDTESSIFNQATWSVVHTGIVSHPSLPVNGLVYNLPSTAVNGNDFAYPEPPFVDYFEYLGNNLWQVIVVGWLGFTESAAQELANEALQALAAAGTIPATNGTNLTIKAWSNHGAMDMRTTAENLKKGYIQNQYALQGYRSTYWTGGAFSNQLSTYLWWFNLEYLVPLVRGSFD
ncbi:amine oxidase flavin-containing superfamily [Aspergillus sclerotioniger CBS 115572]|uniref:Amine oxidase flavin-containing superfamily n=1 Tax=Aspergillus sclerotioniger CBS 115572 TaxID=1450535 RepID=A0A317V8B5_9EURO|nr:amine oxidase flavin-containing superfamily [Aspergillus sclerotioniger CBS 115572]PWY70295.1 amine oxidase flavin-containing superfamily [Aspergillus sclerotioniger CBS 115572]